jgi:hypothetical protein
VSADPQARDALRGALLAPPVVGGASLALGDLAQRALSDLRRAEAGSLLVRGPCEHYHWYPRLPTPHVFVRGVQEALEALAQREFAAVFVGWDVSPEAADRVRARVARTTPFLHVRATFYTWGGEWPEGRLSPGWDSPGCASDMRNEARPGRRHLAIVGRNCLLAGGPCRLGRGDEWDELVTALMFEGLELPPGEVPAQRPRPDGSIPAPRSPGPPT